MGLCPVSRTLQPSGNSPSLVLITPSLLRTSTTPEADRSRGPHYYLISKIHTRPMLLPRPRIVLLLYLAPLLSQGSTGQLIEDRFSLARNNHGRSFDVHSPGRTDVVPTRKNHLCARTIILIINLAGYSCYGPDSFIVYKVLLR